MSVARAICYSHKCRNGTADVEKRMHLHSSLGFSETCLWEKAQTKVDGSGVERIDRIVEFKSEVFVRIELSCFHNEEMGELRIYSPVSALVGIRERAFLHRVSYPHMVEFSSHCVEAGVDVPQALSVCQLSKRHAIILVETTETSYTSIPIVFVDAFLKLIQRKEFHYLSENCFAVVH